MLRVISLGAGVQSTTLALMAAAGEIGPMPDAAIFADTHAESAAVYRHLAKLMEPGVLPFPVYVVSAGSLTDEIGEKRKTGKFVKLPIPAFVGGDGRVGMINRSCTRDYKIRPIQRKVRELLGIVGRRSPKEPAAEQWIGISTDEAQRMKPSRETWVENRWPLIEMNMSRASCLAWLISRGWGAPKSSCTFCPFHDDNQWRALTPEEFVAACEVDDRIRDARAGQRKSDTRLFLHRSCVPLREVDLSKEASLFDLFGNECEGVCGV